MIRSSEKYRNSIGALASEITVEDGRILITGASGLIGTVLVDAFAEANRILHKQFEIYAMGRNKEKLYERFHVVDGVHIIAQDIAEPITIPDIDYIIHAASNADPRSYAIYPAQTILTNVMGAHNVLEYCRIHGTRVLLTSSFEVYGKLDKDVYAEDDYGILDLDRIRTCYPESKRCAEALFKAYHDEYGVDCVIARLSSIYGPTMQENDSKAHAQFIKNALAREPIVLKSAGTQRRTYTYVMDAVSGILKLLFAGEPGEAYNVANGGSVASIAEVAKEVAVLAGTKVVFDLPDKVESKGFSSPQNCVLKTDKIEGLGWQGRYTLEEGLAETIKILSQLKGL